MEKKTINKGNNGNKKLSLYPLKFEEAVKDMLKVQPFYKNEKIKDEELQHIIKGKEC